MPKAIYDMIYRDLKEKIETEQYAYQELLPSEHNLISLYGCSRNTVRRALAELASEGYIQSMQGKGVRNIYQPVDQNAYTVGGIESFKEASRRNRRLSATRVLQFTELTADARIEKRTGFPEGTEVLYIQRLRILDGKPLILEIDPPSDSISERRKGFYQRCGFRENPFHHIHPPYHEGFDGHELTVMTYPRTISAELYGTFFAYLRQRVMADAF